MSKQTWLDAARRAMTRAEAAEAAGDLAEADLQLARANSFVNRAEEVPA